MFYDLFVMKKEISERTGTPIKVKELILSVREALSIKDHITIAIYGVPPHKSNKEIRSKRSDNQQQMSSSCDAMKEMMEDNMKQKIQGQWLK